MKKIYAISMVFLLVFLVSSCEDKEVYKVGATPSPHAEILQYAQPLMQAKGYSFDIVEYTDYVLPNRALNGREIIANFFQHIPYLDAQISDYGYNFSNMGGVHIEPIGLYSKRYETVDELPKDLSIIISSSKTDRPRLLDVLAENNLIDLHETVTAEDIMNEPVETLDSLFDSTYILDFIEVDPTLLYTNYVNESGDAVLINGNYALSNGLQPTKDALLLEGSTSLYVNILVTNTKDINNPFVIALLEVLQSEEVKQYIEETYEGSVIPIN